MYFDHRKANLVANFSTKKKGTNLTARLEAGNLLNAGKGSCPCARRRFDLKYALLRRENTGGKKMQIVPNMAV